MFTHEVQVRVRYAETDQMGYVYYGNYASYFEVARVEAFRKMGVSYKSMEEEGVMMPVTEYHTRFLKPALYDDLLTIKVYIREKPGVRITFDYEVYNEQGDMLCTAATKLVFVRKKDGRPCQPTAAFQEIANELFV